MSVSVRPITKVDSEELLELFPGSNQYGMDVWISTCLGEFSIKKSQTLVAFCENVLVGACKITRLDNSLKRHLGEISDMTVLPAYHDRKVSSALFAKSMEWARAMQLEKVLLSVRAGTKAEQIYRHWGFAEYGRLAEGVKETWGSKDVYDEVLMVKEL